MSTPLIAERTVLFADLRGSTALYEQLGNAEASTLVTQAVGGLADCVPSAGGVVVKTLGDGLMAVFAKPSQAMQAALAMHESLDQAMSRRRGCPALRDLRLQTGIACGEIVELQGDCFGDAVNVAARLIDHAGDNEILVSADVLQGLDAPLRQRFRSLDAVRLRGRAEPVKVHAADGRPPVSELPPTQYGEVPRALEPEAVRLSRNLSERVFDGGVMPVVLGRAPSAQFRVDDSRVSRSHARIDWHGGTFQLSDLSFNGTYVRFGEHDEIMSLRRGRCSLHGRGVIGLGGSPDDPQAPCVEFEVLAAFDTVPQTLV